MTRMARLPTLSSRRENATFVLRCLDPQEQHRRCPGLGEAEELFRATVEYWRRWLSHCTYHGRWREFVQRSALTLKLLSFEPTGAIVTRPYMQPAGGDRRRPQLGLPLHLDPGCRVHVLWPFAAWLHRRSGAVQGLVEGPLARMQIDTAVPCRSCTASTAEADLAEETLDHLEGYRGSGPVRIGNAALRQLQLDIYGELLDAVYLHNKYVEPIGYDASAAFAPPD